MVEGTRRHRARPVRIFVVAQFHQRFIDWCADMGLAPKHPAIVEVLPHHERRLLGVRGGFYTLAGVPGAPETKAVIAILERYEATRLAKADVPAMLATWRLAL